MVVLGILAAAEPVFKQIARRQNTIAPSAGVLGREKGADYFQEDGADFSYEKYKYIVVFDVKLYNCYQVLGTCKPVISEGKLTMEIIGSGY